MKRKKISKACGQTSRNAEDEAGQVEIQYSGCSILNLPSHLLAAILFRLSIKEIIVCKCICKSLYASISNPEFAQSEVCAFARPVNSTYLSRLLYLVDLERATHVSRILFPLELEQDEWFMDTVSSQQCHDYSEIFQVCMKFDSKLKLPVRNLPLDLTDSDDDNEEITLKAKDHRYKVVNSCNGFLCLSEPLDNKPVVVCNPVTGEFIHLPRVIDGKNVDIDCGFGFNPKTNQYKVVMIFEHDTICRMAQVHILGTGSWKIINSAPDPGYKLAFPTYLNGAVHWFGLLGKKMSLIVSFDCEEERFLPFSSPPLMREDSRVNVGMGVLGGCLCVCDSSNQSLVCVWVMKDYGVEKSWTKVFEIDMFCCDIFLYGLYQPIKYMNNGALLMFNYPRNALIYYDPRKPVLKLFHVYHIDSSFEIIAHTPSFISLKDVLAGCNVEVLNVNSRCAGMKLKGELSATFLYEKTADYNSEFYDPYVREYFLHNGRLGTGFHAYWWGNFEYRYSKVLMQA